MNKRRQIDASFDAVLHMPAHTDQTTNATIVMAAYVKLGEQRVMPWQEVSARLEALLPCVKNPRAHQRCVQSLLEIQPDLPIKEAADRTLRLAAFIVDPQISSPFAVAASNAYHTAMKRDGSFKDHQRASAAQRLKAAVQAQKLMTDFDMTAHMNDMVPLIVSKHHGRSITTEEGVAFMTGLLASVPKPRHNGYLALLQPSKPLREAFGIAAPAPHPRPQDDRRWLRTQAKKHLRETEKALAARQQPATAP